MLYHSNCGEILLGKNIENSFQLFLLGAPEIIKTNVMPWNGVQRDDPSLEGNKSIGMPRPFPKKAVKRAAFLCSLEILHSS
jgi:hypothetical protein